MDTRNWFGEHAHTVRLFALVGGVVLAAIILFDILTQKAKTGAATGTTGADTAPTTSGTSATSTLQNPGETYISILEDYSSHVSNSGATDTTINNHPYLPPIDKQPAPQLNTGVPTITAPGPSGGVSGGVHAPTSTGGATVPVPTPHPAEQYTVHSGDSLWSIASRFLGNGADWRELYTWNRSTIGSNPNLIKPGEVLAV